MKDNCLILLLIIYSITSGAVRADSFNAEVDNFDVSNSKSGSLNNTFISPDQIGQAFGNFIPENASETVNGTILSTDLSVIDSTMGSKSEVGSLGDGFFTANKKLGINPDYEPEKEFQEAPEKAWTSNDRLGITDLSVEDVLSSRGLPKVSSTSTSFDILGLPKPYIEGYDELLQSRANRSTEADKDTDKDKQKAKFMDLFR